MQGELYGSGNAFGFPKSKPGMGLLTNDCLFLGLNKNVPSRNSKENFHVMDQELIIFTNR